jgi:hypothetical protein
MDYGGEKQGDSIFRALPDQAAVLRLSRLARLAKGANGRSISGLD